MDAILKEIQEFLEKEPIPGYMFSNAIWSVLEEGATIDTARHHLSDIATELFRDISSRFEGLIGIYVANIATRRKRLDTAEQLHNWYFSPRDPRIQSRILMYVAVRKIERAYASYRIRSRLQTRRDW